jgi:hypothetical protein
MFRVRHFGLQGGILAPHLVLVPRIVELELGRQIFSLFRML